MTPEQLEAEIKNFRFRRSLFGYRRKEVEKCMAGLLERYRAVYAEKEALGAKLAAYEKQEEMLRRALIRAEEAAEAIKREAEKKAEALRAQAASAAASARKEAEARLEAMEKEVDDYRQKLYQRYYSYERESRLLLDRFYSLVRRHIDALEKEVISEVQSFVRRVDEDIASIPRPAMPTLLETAAATRETSKSEEAAGDDWQEKEEALLVGNALLADIYDEQGQLAVRKGTVVTPELIRSLTARGLYGELVAAILGRDEGGGVQEHVGKGAGDNS